MCIFCQRFKSGEQDSGRPTAQDAVEAEHCADLRGRQRPATIITGFLGSGKTTFLNHLLTTPQAPQGLAVLINEFGEVSVDDHLLTTKTSALAGEPVLVTMPNGCLCCKVRGDLIKALEALAPNDSVRHIVIEGSGLAPTLPVAQTFMDPRIQPAFRLSHIINVVDASRFATQLGDTGSYGALCREQMALASVTLLNKVDLVSAEQRQKCVNDLACLGSLVIPCRQSRVNVAQVLREQDWMERLAAGGPVTHLAGVWSVSVQVAAIVDLAKVAEWLRATTTCLAERLMRCKGLLKLTDSRSAVIQGVGQHVEITEEDKEIPRSFVVFIGVGEKPTELQTQFNDCILVSA